MFQDKRVYLIIGLGRFGISFSEKLIELGQTVIGVDNQLGPVTEMSEKIDVAAQIDVEDEASLIKIGAKEVDVAVVAIGESIEASVLCTSILVDIGVPVVIARASNAAHAKVLRRVGAHSVIMPEWQMGQDMAEKLVYPWYSSFTKIEGGDFVFGKISPTSEMIGKTVAELRFMQRYNMVVVLLEHDGKQSTPSPDRPFEAEDKLWVLGHRNEMNKLIKKQPDNKTEDI